MIVHYRADSRVVHGQTTTKINKENPVDGVLIIDDEIAADKFMMGVYSSTLGNMRCLGFSVEKALRKLPEADASKKRYLVILKSPETARRLVEGGYAFTGPLNIGPQPNRPDARLVFKMLYLTNQEIADLDFLEANGVDLIINPMLTSPVSWAEAKEKAGVN